MPKSLTGVLVDVNTDKVETVTLDGTLSDFYRVLHCDCIDITTRLIDGKCFDIVCDDEGLLKSPFRVSAVNRKREPMLVGNLFICSSDEEGESISLTDSEIEHVKNSTLGIIQGFDFWTVLANVEYC